jgi:hypothetical protein
MWLKNKIQKDQQKFSLYESLEGMNKVVDVKCSLFLFNCLLIHKFTSI